jgi:hypothetical protein
MNAIGDDSLLAASRRALVDALQALRAHMESVVVVGAQAIYLHTGKTTMALAEMTKDSDLAVDARTLAKEPLLEEALSSAGFLPASDPPEPGSWISPSGIQVDLMVPESLAGARGRRGARIPPHSNRAARRVVGLEAAVVDYAPMVITSLDPVDERAYFANVATPAALLIAKLHKLGDRQASPGRLVDKDAHDIYRLLVAIPSTQLASAINRLRRDPLAGPVTERGVHLLEQLFVTGPDAVGSMMAGRAEEGVGDPAIVSASVTALARALLDEVKE